MQIYVAIILIGSQWEFGNCRANRLISTNFLSKQKDNIFTVTVEKKLNLALLTIQLAFELVWFLRVLHNFKFDLSPYLKILLRFWNYKKLHVNHAGFNKPLLMNYLYVDVPFPVFSTLDSRLDGKLRLMQFYHQFAFHV